MAKVVVASPNNQRTRHSSRVVASFKKEWKQNLPIADEMREQEQRTSWQGISYDNTTKE